MGRSPAVITLSLRTCSTSDLYAPSLTAAHSARVVDGGISAEVLVSVALLFLPSLPDMALCVRPDGGDTCLLVTVTVCWVSESQGLPHPNRTSL